MTEVMFRQCEKILYTNYLMIPDYYTQLFSSFKSLMVMFGDSENIGVLTKAIKDIEGWLSDEYNPMTLAEAETRMFQNMDLLSGFEVNGIMITQQEIYTRLNEIKSWLNSLLYDYMPMIRFTQQIKVE